MLYWVVFSTAFFTGLVSSLHCVGMCGPISMALPIKNPHLINRFLSILIYNFGRIITYSFLGFLFGMIGNSITAIIGQQFFTFAIGIGLILSLLPFQKFKLNFLMKHFYRLKQYFAQSISQAGYLNLLKIGILNGFLPCGAVFIALSAAAVLAQPILSSIYLFVFGLGTIPLMFLAGFLFRTLSLSYQKSLQKITPFFIIIFAISIIVRGIQITEYQNDKSKNSINCVK
jgi:hypothetical protein